MTRIRPTTAFAALLLAGLAAPALADSAKQETPPPPAPPGGAASAAPAIDSTPPAAAPTPADPANGKDPAAPSATPASPPAKAADSGGGKTADPKAEAAQAQDPKDRELEELRKKYEELLKRVDQLEKKQSEKEPEKTPEKAPETLEPAPGGGPKSGSASFIPNISAIGNLILGAGDTKRVPNRGRFSFEEFEIALQDAVAPKLRYDVFLSAAKGEDWKLGMEEGYLTASALMPGVNARIGRIRVPFGKFNPLHSHVWPFITQPSVLTAFLGPDGLISDGAVVEYTLPTKGFFARADVGAWQTTSDTEDGLGFGAGKQGAYSGRFWLGKELDHDTELELGFSRYQGNGSIADVGRRLKAVNGIDLTYRNYPGNGQRILATAELLNHVSDVPGHEESRLGGFAYLAYRMNQFWEMGARADYTKFAFPLDGYDWGGSLFITHYLTEQTSLRLEYQYTRSPLQGTGSGIYFQILFGSGPHTHPLQ